MDSKDSFIQFISIDHSIDYWSDMAIEHAIELANAMSESDWEYLHENWSNLNPMVQSRIAEVAGETSNWNDHISQMLVSMLSCEFADVVEASLDSLNSVYQQTPKRLKNTGIELALESVTPTDKVVAKVLESLKQRIKRR